MTQTTSVLDEGSEGWLDAKKLVDWMQSLECTESNAKCCWHAQHPSSLLLL